MTSKQKRRETKRRRHYSRISDPAVEQMERSFEDIPRALLRRIIVAQEPQPWYKRLIAFARSHNRKLW